MRLHFILDDTNFDNVNENTTLPFCGHIYIKGFFFSSSCHLDLTQAVVNKPFFFHIPYRSDCQVLTIF